MLPATDTRTPFGGLVVEKSEAALRAERRRLLPFHLHLNVEVYAAMLYDTIIYYTTRY
jgi:hypothetical protein